MDAFFAAVEQQRHPELIGKPLIIGGSGDPTKRGVVSTASYEARKFGIHSAMPLRTANKLCPHAVFLRWLRGVFEGVWKDKKSGEFPNHGRRGIDEAFLDISQIDKSAEEIAKKSKRRSNRRLVLPAHWYSTNKLLAKIASDMQKPDGLTILTRWHESRIWPLSVRKLWGVGPKTENYLKEMSIETIGKLAAVPLDKLIERFGESYGRYLYDASKGIDESPLITH